MPEDEVVALSEGALESQGGARADGTTHVIISESFLQPTTYVWLTMPDGKLHAARLCWDYKMKAVACAEWPRLKCDEAPPNKTMEPTR